MKISKFLTDLFITQKEQFIKRFPPPKPRTPDEELAAELRGLTARFEDIVEKLRERGYKVTLQNNSYIPDKFRLTEIVSKSKLKLTIDICKTVDL